MLDLFRMGLNHRVPHFCAKAYWFKDDLGLSMTEVSHYMDYARSRGYDTASDERTMMMDVQARRNEETKRVRAQMQKEEAERQARAQAASDRLDQFERDVDLAMGGGGHTLDEKAAAGQISPENYLRHLMNRSVLENAAGKK